VEKTAPDSSQKPQPSPVDAGADAAGGLLWYVAHTRARCEKKLAQYCGREGFLTTLPCYQSVKKYRGKTVVFHKPLFPNYLFLRLLRPQREKVYQSDYVANLLDVPDQREFEQQLGDILEALEANVEVRLAPTIGPGAKVRIKTGPLQGMEAWVESRSGATEALLRLDFIGQAAAVRVQAWELEEI
jgi:transcription antitermination factor NusG